MSRILVLDANHRSALAATRSLGARGLSVFVADETERSLSGASRYSQEHLRYASPYHDPERFVEEVQSHCQEQAIDVLFPMTDITTAIVVEHRKRFPEVRLPFASFGAVERLSNKRRLLELARSLGVPVPRTWVVEGRGELRDLLPRVPFPIVLKPYRSRIPTKGGWIKGEVRYAGSPREAEELVESLEPLREHPFLLQEYVSGEGRGVFTLYANGRPIVFFAHRRLRERPPSGGASVLSESIEVSAALESIARRLLEAVGWHGVAMVEFKVAPDGTPFLIEVNARFWGSLQLAVDAGVDFPWLLYQVAMGEEPGPVGGYRVGLKSRWLMGDVAHVYRLFKGDRGLATPPAEKWRRALRVMKPFARDTRYDVNRWDDPKPFLFEMTRLFGHESGR